MGIKDQLRSLDTHSSVSSEFRVYTFHGAILSLITVFAIIYLVFTEVIYNFQTTLIERVHVNATSSAGIEVEFDITLNNVPCARLSIDANDPNGQTQSLHLNRDHHVWKHRVRVINEQYEDNEETENNAEDEKSKNDDGSNSRGRVLMKRKSSKTRINYLGDRTKLEFGSTLLHEEHLESELEQLVANMTKEADKQHRQQEEEYCGSCYGAGKDGECCNTCDDVKRAYHLKSWVLRDMTNIEQCNSEDDENQIEITDDEGCNIHGVVALSSGGGNLHLAPGRGSGGGSSSGHRTLQEALSDDDENEEENGAEGNAKNGTKTKKKKKEVQPISLVDLVLRTFEQWNVSHTVNKIRFGEEFPGHVHQLDSQVRVIEDTYGMYQYYFQVVPTLYKYLNGTTIQTNQYSVTEHLRHVSPGSGRGLPGVFFFYEVSPLHVEISEVYTKGYVAFFTSVCAIVGGVVSVMGMIDQLFFTRLFAKAKTQTLAR